MGCNAPKSNVVPYFKRKTSKLVFSPWCLMCCYFSDMQAASSPLVIWEFVQPWLQCKSDMKQITDDKFWTAGVTAWLVPSHISKSNHRFPRLTLTTLLQWKKMELWLSVWPESAAEIWAIFYFLKEAKVRHKRVPSPEEPQNWCNQVSSLEWSDHLTLMSSPSQGCIQIFIVTHMII